MPGIAKIVLDNVKLPSEKAELLIPFFRQIKRQYGDPVALVHDKGRRILSAINTVFPGVPDFICHFHFLRDIGKDLLEKEYAIIRRRLTKHKIRSLLRQRAKALEKIIGDNTQVFCHLALSIDGGEPPVMEKMDPTAAYAMIHWTFDRSALDGYGFPFDYPHLVFYRKPTVLYDLVNGQLGTNKTLSKLWRPLTRVVEDPQLKRAASQMDKKVTVFNKLRKALSIAVAQTHKGLNDDGGQVSITSIEKKVTEFRQEIFSSRHKDDYQSMIKQIDKYWDKLFADPIVVNTPNGQLTIQPHRTNNIL